MDAALLYVGGVTLLFFFWAYGIVAFVRDLRRTYLPAVRKLLAARRRNHEEDRERERAERERELY